MKSSYNVFIDRARRYWHNILILNSKSDSRVIYDKIPNFNIPWKPRLVRIKIFSTISIFEKFWMIFYSIKRDSTSIHKVQCKNIPMETPGFFCLDLNVLITECIARMLLRLHAIIIYTNKWCLSCDSYNINYLCY